MSTITGQLVLDISVYGRQAIPDTWNYEDIGNYYGAGANGLSFRENLYKIVFQSPATPDKPTRIRYTEPRMQGLEIVNRIRSSKINADRAYIYGIPESDRVVIRGTIPAGRSSFSIKGAIPHPELLLKQEFLKYLKNKGINIKNGVQIWHKPYQVTASDTLAIQYSPRLDELVKRTNYESINLFAEHLGRQLSVMSGKGNKVGDAPEAIKGYWKRRGINTEGMQLYDCCGLSRYNILTAEQFTQILDYMHDSSECSNIFYEALPVAGEHGTLEYMGRNTALEGNMHAKSGTIDNVKAYSGYIRTANGHKAAFAIMVNNYSGSSSDLRKKLSYLLEGIALLDKTKNK